MKVAPQEELGESSVQFDLMPRSRSDTPNPRMADGRRVVLRLRDHPCMAYRGQSNWPPVWMWVGGERNQNPKGEIGILHEVTLPPAGAPNRCSLIVEHEGAVYLGSLL